ncbi:MAG: GNAT family N-acetyltransferase [Candidatus Thorarchaeota archaeon]|jgi:RimJ/RimL family protein N-acetyltransferase
METRFKHGASDFSVIQGSKILSETGWQIIMHKLLIEIPTRIETESLIVRKYEKDDGKDLLDLLERNNNRDFLREAADEVDDIKTLDDAEIDVREHAVEWESRKRFVMGIWLKSTGEYVGQIWIEPKQWEVPSFELGYYIDQGYIRKGIATEAARRSLKFLFEDLKAHKVIIITRDTNERSWKLAERLGFTKEGHHRESSIKNGKRWGLYYYGMLKSEFKSA